MNEELKTLWLEHHGRAETRRILAQSSESQRQALHRLLSRMSEMDAQKLAGALEIEPLDSIADVLTVIADLDHFEFYPDVGSERELGVYLVESGVMRFPDSALPYLDYEKIGTEYRADHSGASIGSGYVVRKDELPRQALDADRPRIFKVQLYAPQGIAAMTSPYCLTLPASPEQMEMAKLFIGVTDFTQAHTVRIECPIASLQSRVDQSPPTVELLNELALEIERIQRMDEKLIDLCAILEAEQPDTFAATLEVVRCYDDYEVFQRNVSSPADYGEFVLYRSKSPADDFDFKDEVRDFIDYEAYGRYKMDEDGVRQTDFGLVRRPCDPFPSAGYEMRMQ